MPTLASGIQTSLQALLAQSQVMEVIENNVANASTEGYHRQKTVLSSTTTNSSVMYYTSDTTGSVEVSSIKRFTVNFFDSRYRALLADGASYEYQSEIYTQMETILSDLSDDGISTQLDGFWSDWQSLASDPTSTSIRTELLSNASALCEKFNSNAKQLISLREDLNLSVENMVTEVNSLAEEVAGLNSEISRLCTLGQQPNELLDQRDLALDKLAELIGATSSVQDNNEVIVSIGGHVLVTGDTVSKLVTVSDTSIENLGVDNVVWENSGAEVNLTGGELEGILKVRDYYIPEYLDQLNELAAKLITTVNSIHGDGYTLDGSESEVFFTGTSALDIGVNSDLGAEDIAASSDPGETGNSDIATQIYNLRDQSKMSSGTQTFGEFYNALMTQLASDTQQAEANYKQYTSVLEALATQRESITGVSLDEEAANLSMAEKAYEAAARIMTAFDSLLDTIINEMGLVGR